jgi:hypothetical protein
VDEVERIADARDHAQREARQQGLGAAAQRAAQHHGAEGRADEIGLQRLVPPVDDAQQHAGHQQPSDDRKPAPGQHVAKPRTGLGRGLQVAVKHRGDHADDQRVDAVVKRKPVGPDEIDIGGRRRIVKGEQAA